MNKLRLTRVLHSMLAVGTAGIGCSAPAPPAAAPETQTDAAQDSTGTAAPASPEPAQGASPVTPVPTPTPTTAPDVASPKVPSKRPVITATRPQAEPTPTPAPPEPYGDTTPSTALTVTMLSRGKGVPEQARNAYKDIRALLEQQRDAYAITDLRTQRIGLEGEARLCVEFRDPRQAQTALAEIRKRIAGIDLIDVAQAPCPSPKEKQP